MTQQSMLAAVSGIAANQTYLDEVANNIANVNTVGYKAGSVQFQDLLSQQLSGASAPSANGTSGGINPVAIGSGVRVGANQLNLNEGTFEQTGQPTDVAINGAGYLVVENGGQQQFTRDGSLTQDANGDLTTQGGALVQGWIANASGVVNNNGPLTAIKIPTGATIGASATTELTVGGNLPAWNGTGTPPSDVTTTYNAYDQLGNVIPVTLTFSPGTAANTWTVQGTIPNASGSGTTKLFTSPPTITFDTTGQITSISGVTANSDGSFSLKTTGTLGSGGAGYTNLPASASWNINFPAPGSAGDVTQFNSAKSLQIQSGDGHTSGQLTNYSIGADGTITGSFSNGTTLALGQIALAGFANPGGLSDQGGGLFAAGPNSGQALIGAPGTGGRGQLLGGELEQSNVDLGTELTDLINAQEAYTANTKVLTATNTSIQSLEAVQ